METVTRQRDVEPGNITGIYHIIVCNLSFDTSWQDLKDFVRPTCDVDHVEVFRSSTSGWIRVEGQENFEKAWALLDGGRLKGRAIIASDKNRTESIKIKEVVEIDPAMEDSVSQLGGLPTSQYLPAQHFGALVSSVMQEQVYIESSLQLTIGSHTFYPPAPRSYSAPCSMSFAAADLGSYELAKPFLAYNGEYNTAVLAHALMSGLNIGYPTTLLEPNWGLDASGPEAMAQIPPTTYLVTEQRKVILTQLANKAQADEVKAWVHKRCGVYTAAISSIEMPCKRASTELRGHAFIVFETTFAATHTVKLLNNSSFKGRKVAAHLANEGLPQAVIAGSHGKGGKGADVGGVGRGGSGGGGRDGGRNKQNLYQGRGAKAKYEPKPETTSTSSVTLDSQKDSMVRHGEGVSETKLEPDDLYLVPAHKMVRSRTC